MKFRSDVICMQEMVQANLRTLMGDRLLQHQKAISNGSLHFWSYSKYKKRNRNENGSIRNLAGYAQRDCCLGADHNALYPFA